ncbi:cadherin-like domain-containing protein [Luteolibacter yonseiensis]|uniref:Cadherin-like domain-containing protein n=1 Tax=Luteolibacter yonseiensis TaxID=1144680 RepID=A0A934R0B8_9BACT|nr:cadherin-like domain-containing protein [Luteolibacter yonseiensis]MBK1814541.1 cadherin-like domain-containing protein [Luteolibacter yonseiensis]
MKKTPSSPGAVPRYLAASLLLSLLPVTGQTLVNGNFDAQTFSSFPGYASANGGTVTGWTLSNTARTGLNSSTGPFWTAPCGPIPSAGNCAIIQASNAPASISQTVTGLTIGTRYNVSCRISARSGNTPSLVFSTDGDGPTVKLEVIAPPSTGALATATVFRNASFEFTATATSHLITFTNDRTSGDHTLLLDDVTVAPSATTSSWSFAPWTSDADSGIDSQYVYTHAHHLSLGKSWQPININGVDFNIGDGTGSNRFTLTNLNANFLNRTPNNLPANTGSYNLAKDFRYDGPNTGITLQNLKPNTQYVFTLYGLAFDAAGVYRSATFNSTVPGSNQLSVNLNHYGQGNGIRINHTYTTDALGSPVTISYPTHGSGTFHSGGFTNREAVASTPPVRWTVHPWSGDDTSGVSPNHPYTHAFKFGSATNLNVNGINFTGLAGGNPTGTNYTSAGLGSVYNNDVNAVTASGSILGRDFIFGGFPETHNLSGLTPGKNYVFTLYTVGWSDGVRRAALIGGTGEGSSVLHQDQYGNDQGARFEYTYTASASGTATITASGIDVAVTDPFDRKSIHTYAISNREADPYVNKTPEFTLQPVGATLGIGASYTLRGAAIGSETLSYQWKKGTADIPGETSPVLVLNGLTAADSGAYTLVVSNGVTVTSNVANVNVLENIPGYGNTGVGVDGQLLANGLVDPHFKLIVNPDDTSSDTVYVQTNLPGAWLANSATSKWIGPRANTAGAAGLVTPAGTPSDAGAGDGVYVYRARFDLTGFDLSTVLISGKWSTDNEGVKIRVNGTDVGFPNTVGTTFATLVPFSISNSAFPGLLTTGVNNIDFFVKNIDAGTGGGLTGLRIDEFTAVGAIPPGTPPHIAIQPVGGNGRHNSMVTLAVGATGSSPLTYQWFKGADPVPDATEATLPIYVEDFTAAGSYTVKVTGSGPTTVTSDPAVITVTNANPVTSFDDVGSTDQDVAKSINVADLLANDTSPDADGDTVNFTGVSAASSQGGTVSESDGIILYTPKAGFTGSDTFTYSVDDGGWGGTATETVIINVVSAAVTPPGNMTLVISGGTATGTFTGTAGKTYILQRSTTLQTGSWSTVDTEVAPPSGIVTVEDPAPPAGKAFYRIGYGN